MKRTVILVLVAFLSAALVFAQDEQASSQDSLQVADSLQVTEPETSTEPVIPNDPSSVLQSFFQALKSGDSLMVTTLISSEGLENIEVMLDILHENLSDDQEAVMSRLTSAGYSATSDEIEDWNPEDYLAHTVVLPVMKGRYVLYEMEIGDYSDENQHLMVPLTFTTASGVQLPFQAELVREDDQWKVSTFMGLNSFP
ncbi:MAG: hypothetical protein GF388_09895 [Candidatus Aegiribacteria sp.]|nr:hypothetical protein [Candidatus Aegiribacteria sp.]MBD3295344.1 hypothetical protein [Candidatus Fermentibacteria bacterium]